MTEERNIKIKNTFNVLQEDDQQIKKNGGLL